MNLVIVGILGRALAHFESSSELSHLHEWKHHFWQTSYASHLVLDEEASVSQFKYILSNSVKEGLVNHPQL